MAIHRRETAIRSGWRFGQAGKSEHLQRIQVVIPPAGSLKGLHYLESLKGKAKQPVYETHPWNSKYYFFLDIFYSFHIILVPNMKTFDWGKFQYCVLSARAGKENCKMKNRKVLWMPILMALMLIGLVFVNVAKTQDKSKPEPSMVRKIVVFKAGVTDDQKDAIINWENGTKLKDLHLIKAHCVEASTEVIERLRKRAEVERIDDDVVIQALERDAVGGSSAEDPIRDKTVKSSRTAIQPAQVLPWGISQIKANLSWTYSQGATVNVAVVDTGIDLTHPDLAAHIKGGINTIYPANPYRRDSSYTDDNGHGTHVSGIIGAINNTIGVVGVGPQINLYAVKVLDMNGSGYLSDIIEGLQWCASHNIKVANMSLGTTSDIISFHQAIQAAYNAGITLVAAAGNDGKANSVEYPAKYAEVIAVAATDSNNHLATFSSYGPQVAIAAPGVNIYSTYKGSIYAYLSGTSMATPHVTGTVALKLALGAYTPAQIRIILQATATNLGLTPDKQGAGLVNALSVVQY